MKNLARPSAESSVRRLWRQWGSYYLMLFPAAFFFILFHYVPMYGITIAFKDFRLDLGLFGSPWIGWEHFERLFTGNDFRRALRNTVVISGLHLAIGFWAPIILALLLHEIRIRWFVRTVQTFTYLPHFFSWVILGGIVIMILSHGGPLNTLLGWFGLGPVAFLTEGPTFLSTLILSSIWKGAGYGAVIYLAALSGISPDLYEAAKVDGASRWQQVRHITLPALRPTIVILFILNLGHFLDAGFDQIYNLYNPLVYNVGDIIDTYVLRRLQSLDYSLATAAGLFKSAVGAVLIVLANYLARRLSDGEEGIW